MNNSSPEDPINFVLHLWWVAEVFGYKVTLTCVSMNTAISFNYCCYIFLHETVFKFMI